MTARVWPWILTGGAAAALVYLGTRPERQLIERDAETADTDPALRNAALQYRPIGASGEPYPAWVRALRGKSGVYVIREQQRDGSAPIVYVGESHTRRLYQTLTRHFQTVRHEAKEIPMT
jgi:hypothetical protein